MYKQPRVPQQVEGQKITDYLYSLGLFLKDFALGVWREDANQSKEIEEMKKRLDALEGR